MPTGRSLHRIWFYIPDARYTEQQRKRASSEYLRAVSGSIESDITVWIEWNFHMRQDMNYSPQDRGNSVLPLNQTDIALTTEDLAIYRRRVIGLVPCSSTMSRYRQCAGERGYDGFFWLKQPNFGLDNPAVRQVNSGQWINKVMRIAVKSPVLGYTGSRLMGTNEVRIWHDQMLWKPGLGATGEPALSNNIGWHQDYAHWQYANTMNFCTAWVTLQDIDESNDSMRLMAGASSGRGESEIP